jgi:hypothetical protein
MDSDYYKQIKENIMMPFRSLNFDEMYWHQDSDPKHTSKLCREAANYVNIKWVNNLLNIVLGNRI